jgi:hypothetical protein
MRERRARGEGVRWRRGIMRTTPATEVMVVLVWQHAWITFFFYFKLTSANQGNVGVQGTLAIRQGRLKRGQGDGNGPGPAFVHRNLLSGQLVV